MDTTPRPDLSRAEALGVAVKNPDGTPRSSSDVFQDLTRLLGHCQEPGPKLVCLPNGHEGVEGQCRLSPFDISCKGRSTPMVWFYDKSLDTSRLTAALETVLSTGYPVLCGRYALPAIEGGPPLSLNLNNKGVSLHVGDVSVDSGHLPPYSMEPLGSATGVQVYDSPVQDQWLPPKETMDPDVGSPDAPLLALKVTRISGACTGTAIGMLAQHGVVDADSMIVFMKNWAACYRGADGLAVVPSHVRLPDNWAEPSESGADGPAKPESFRIRAVPPGEAPRPEFLPVMPRIMGRRVCIVPLEKAALTAWKADAQAAAGTTDFVFSQDDVVTARVWRALARTRCEQLGIPCDSDQLTTCSRASNFRQRCSPPLGEGYCANGVCQVWTQMSVRELLRDDAGAVAGIAKVLREDLTLHTDDLVARRARWLRSQQERGYRTVQMFDESALTFIISSWMFDWEGADFDAKPVAFDHAAHTPVVSVFVPRQRVGEGKLSGGINVYTCGTEQAVQRFTELLMAK